MANTKIGLAVVGVGYWGGNYVRILSQLPTCRMLAVVDRDKAHLDKLCASFPAVRGHTDLTACLATEPEVHAVVVCTPASTHFSVVQQCLLADRHVLCEKPLTVDSKEAEALAALAAERGRVLLVGHTFLFNNAFARLCDHTLLPEFGDLYYLYCKRTNLGPVRSDVDVTWDLMTHDVSQLLVLMSLHNRRPLRVSASAASPLNSPRYDVVFATLFFEGNVAAHMHASWIDPMKERKMTVVGSRQKIVFDDVELRNRITVYNQGALVVPPQQFQEPEGDFHLFKLHVLDGDTIIPFVKSSEPLKEQCIHFLEGIRTGGPVKSDGTFGAQVVQVLERISQSAAQGGVCLDL